MIDNNLKDSNLPARSASPTSVQYSPPSVQGRKSLIKTKPIPFPQSAALVNPSKLNTFTSLSIPKEAPITDFLLEEIDQLLLSQAEKIEKKFKQLEEKDAGKSLIDTFLGIESWGYEILSTTSGKLKEGVEFLDSVLPEQIDFLKEVLPSSIFDQISSAANRQEWGGVPSVVTTFLTCLNAGAQGAALICKVKILEQSKEFLREFKAHFASQMPSFSSQSLTAVKGDQKGSLTETNQNKIQKMIEEWDLQITLQEKELAREKLNYGLNASSNVLTLLSDPLTYLPKEVLLDYLNVASGIASTVSWVTAGIEFVGLAVELKHIREESHTVNEWKNSFQKWHAKHHPRFQITENGAQRTDFKPIKTPPTRSPQQLEKELFQAIKSQNVSMTLNQLKTSGVECPSTITTQKDLMAYLLERPDLITKHIAFQQKLDALDLVIYTSENLLVKREAIMKKKTLILQPNFSLLKTKIQERKKQAFIKDLHKLVHISLRSPHCTPQEIEQQFLKWGLFKAPIPAQNLPLLLAFRSFKLDKLHQEPKSEPLLASQQKFLQELNAWSNQPEIVDQHFENWFQLQDTESLIKDYIDHQETIEHTVKNSLVQMVQQKHQLESECLNFKSKKTHLHFTVATASLGVTLTFAVLGLLTLPLGGVGVILLSLSIASAALSFAFLAAGYMHALHYKPHALETMTPLFSIQMAWANLRNSIATYSHQAKEKKLLEVAKILRNLHQITITHGDKKQTKEYQQALVSYQKAKIDLEKSQKKIDFWTQKINKFESKITESEWKDFSIHASLNTSLSFDTLDAFQEALQACDLQLLNQETKNLLRVYLGINLQALDNSLKNNPEEVKKSLQEFFALSTGETIEFVRAQQGRLTKGLIKLRA